MKTAIKIYIVILCFFVCLMFGSMTISIVSEFEVDLTKFVMVGFSMTTLLLMLALLVGAYKMIIEE